MDKYEYNLKLEEITKLVEQENFEEAAALADTVDWRRVRNVRTLCMVSEIYEANDRLEESRDILIRAYRKTKATRSILFRLTEISIKLKDFDEAAEYYSEFVNAAPNDNSKYLLKYMIYRGRGAAIEDQIEILEEYNQREFTEKYAYEVAKLYYRVGNMEKCVSACDDLILWFRQGKYVIRALEMKQKITDLTPVQQAIYDNRNEASLPKAEMVEAVVPELEKVILENMPESTKEVITNDVISETEKELAQVVTEHTAAQNSTEGSSREENGNWNFTLQSASGGHPAPKKDYGFNTADLQAELAKSMRDIVSGITRKQDESDIIEPVNDIVNQEEEPLHTSEHGSDVENQMSIDDILVSMSKETAAAVSEVKSVQETAVSEEEKEEKSQKTEEVLKETAVEETEDIEEIKALQEKVEAEAAALEKKAAALREKAAALRKKAAGTEISREKAETAEAGELQEKAAETEDTVSREKAAEETVSQEKAAAEKETVPEKMETVKTEEVPEKKDAAETELADKAVQEKKEEVLPVYEKEEAVEKPQEGKDSGVTAKTKDIAEAISSEPAPEPEEIPTKLTEEQNYIFSYFSTIGGLREQIAGALYHVMKKMSSMDQTSRTGNMVVLGAEGSGKTSLGVRFAKCISQQKGEESAKVAKIYAEDLNKKDIASTIAKISGGTLIIEEAGDLDDAVVEQLSIAMEFRTDALLVILEDDKKYLKELFDKHPAFAEKFTAEITIPVFTNDELVTFGKTYAYDEDYRIDETAVVALYERIGELQASGQPVTVIDVKEIIDAAIKRSEKFGFRKFGMIISNRRYDEEDRVILYEKDFR